MRFPDLKELYNRKTLKWTRYPADTLPMWVAESDFGTCPEVKQALVDAVEREAFGYPPETPGLGEALANFYRKHFGWGPNPEWVFPIPDVVRGVWLAIEHLTRPGTPTIVPTPSYMPFLGLTGVTGRETMMIDAYGGIDLNDVEECLRKGAGSIVLVSPFNPLGFTFDREFLRELAELVDRYDARIIADEIHAPLVYQGRNIPVASVSETAARVTVTVTATSKAWNIAGLKCAQMVFSNAEDAAAWERIHPLLREGVSTIGLIAAEASYRADTAFLDDQLAVLLHNRDTLAQELPRILPGLATTVPDATFLMWLDFRDTPLADRPAAQILERCNIALNEGTTFGPGGAGHARLNFACTPDTLNEALERFSRAY
ncbi:MalY/PatB family protein [Corynebacterium sp.]|uniref:MalY/PatB family protein n=1 Tax=Corynebacterium sp. TaxID=1720 RepID=UPI0026DD13B5|nr:aminotransferase class I/II-fold pyridoxal phosphate-dependent enzyme [Corynebacterium sp.]MDO5076067.1 aminotransferase class I/II-fold pyridoxal phosphate-dependent enzyme [Corynebacterium sp.]